MKPLPPVSAAPFRFAARYRFAAPDRLTQCAAGRFFVIGRRRMGDI
jgi:hypothetical protein